MVFAEKIEQKLKWPSNTEKRRIDLNFSKQQFGLKEKGDKR